MPRPRSATKQKVQIAHLKFAAITNKTLIGYRKAVHDFCWIDNKNILKPRSVTLLGQMLSEYLNDLFVTGAPMYL